MINNLTPTVKQLLILNIIFFLGSLAVKNSNEFLALYYFENPQFYFWQLLTSMFMHGGPMHLLFNMFALYSFGSLLENIWGSKKFIFFYISCGLGAAFLHSFINYIEIHSILKDASLLHLSSENIRHIFGLTLIEDSNYRADLFQIELIDYLKSINKYSLLNQTTYTALESATAISQIPALGASGAIYGLLVAFAFMFPNAELALLFIPVPVKAKYFVPFLLLVDLFLGVTGKSLFGGSTGIAHFAHIGGAAIGFIMMWYWKKNSFNNRRWN